MIASIKGQIIAVGTESVVVEVAGVGYEVWLPTTQLNRYKVGEDARLLTYHHIRENVQVLYGFDDEEAKRLFEQLIGVSGVGPKTALAVMSLGSASRLKQAIASEDIAYIASAAGLGKRSAERVVVELKDKVGEDYGELGAEPGGDDALEALLSLGYSRSQSAKALSKIESNLPVEEKIKQALKKIK